MNSPLGNIAGNLLGVKKNDAPANIAGIPVPGALSDLAKSGTAGALAGLGGKVTAVAGLLSSLAKDKEEYKFDPGLLEQAGAKTAGANALSAGASQVARAGNINLANTQNRMAQQVANQNNGASGLSAAMALAEGMSADNSNAQNMAQAAQMQSQAQEQQASGQQFLNQNVRVVKKKELFGSESLANMVDGVKGLTGGFLKGAADMRGFHNNTLDSQFDKEQTMLGHEPNANTASARQLLGQIESQMDQVARAVGLTPAQRQQKLAELNAQKAKITGGNK